MGAGRPPKYTSIEKLQQRIDEYFESGREVREIVVGRGANERIIEVPVPTVTGLALFLGFADRRSFYDYCDSPRPKTKKFAYAMKRARTFMERHYEQLLQSGNYAGAIFALKNFGWSDKQEVEHTGDLSISVVDRFGITDNSA